MVREFTIGAAPPQCRRLEWLMAMSASQHYEFRRREKENQNIEKSKRRRRRPSDERFVALEETKAASPQKLKVLDTHESPWRWEREESEEDLAVGGLPRKKENVRKKNRWEIRIVSRKTRG